MLSLLFGYLEAVPIFIRLPVFLVAGLYGLIWLWTKHAQRRFDIEKHRKIPGPRPLPLFGNTLEFGWGDPNDMLSGAQGKWIISTFGKPPV